MQTKTFIISAVSADGFIAQDQDQTSTTWTSREDFKWFQKKTKQAGVCVMGRSTWDTIGRLLPSRINIVMTRNPENVTAFDAEKVADLAETIQAGTALEANTLYVTSESPATVVELLEKASQPEIAICGGSSVYTQFLSAGLVDEVYLTIEPVFFGTGVPLFNAKLEQALELQAVENLSPQTLLLTYAVAK